MRNREILVSAVVLTLGLSGCASQPSAIDGLSGQVATAASPAVREALSGGSVTIDEYETAFRNYVSCMEVAGFSVAEHDPDANGVINYSISNDAVVDGADKECYDEHYGAVDTAYQVAHEDSSSSAEFLGDCLRDKGVDPADTMEERLTQFENEGLDIGEC